MKLFVTDYDGTLFTSEEGITKNILMLKKLQKRDFKIVIATGRSYPSIKNQILLYQIPYDYLACSDGSIIYDKEGKPIYYEEINREIVLPFIKFCEKYDYEEIQFSYPEGYMNSLEEDKALLGVNLCISTLKYDDKLVKSFLKLKKKYPNYNYLCYPHPNFAYLCIKPLNVSKSLSIQILSEKLNILKEDVYVIGDSANDIEMLEDFHGVGMRNSCNEVLEVVSKTYNEVSEYIKDLL